VRDWLIGVRVVDSGGGISKAGEALFGPLREELARQMTAWSRARIDVRPARLADDSVLWGALVLAEQEPISVS